MKILVFETNIDCKQHIKTVESFFNNHNGVLDWWIDIEDVDNVLRIEAVDELNERDVINLMNGQGFYCGELVG